MATKREYISEDFQLNWNSIESVCEELMHRPIQSASDLNRWMLDRNELDAFLQEDFAWRYIRMTCDTENTKYAADFQYYTTEIEPKLAPWSNALDQKIASSPFLLELNKPEYSNYFRKLKTNLALFREENISLETSIQLELQRYQTLTGSMSIEWNQNEYTIAQAAVFLKDNDRQIRQEVWELIAQRRLNASAELDESFDKLKNLRNQIALNAGHTNYRDYMFASLGRFDYDTQDCLDFHEAIEQKIVPILAEEAKKRQQSLGLSSLKPWDMDVDPFGHQALQPFKNADDLIQKTTKCFSNLAPYFGDCLQNMHAEGYFDLESRKGKAPGGYNYPLAESGKPFIFMNSAGTFQDLVTMIHEGGHAIHTYLTSNLALNEFKDPPSEVAELASMSMELLSMKYWNVFFDNEEELKRAKREQLLDVLKTLPWVATIDAFQHWIYTNPEHTIEERDVAWLNVYKRFGAGFTDWEQVCETQQVDMELAARKLWQKQLHIFEVPFYYIEYGMAQLGAIGIWRNFNNNSKLSLKNYQEALKIGYTKTIPEIYETAGVPFNFSASYIGELADFIQEELVNLN